MFCLCSFKEDALNGDIFSLLVLSAIHLPPRYNGDFDQYVQLTKQKKPEVALQQLRNTRADNDGKRLKLMNELATTLDKNGELPQDTATKVKFDQYVQLTAKKDSVVALQHLRNTKPKKREMVDEPDEPSETTSEPSKDQLRGWGF